MGIDEKEIMDGLEKARARALNEVLTERISALSIFVNNFIKDCSIMKDCAVRGLYLEVISTYLVKIEALQKMGSPNEE